MLPPSNLPTSATESAMHMHPAPLMSQHHTALALPPAASGYENVTATVEKRPEMLTAKEKEDQLPNSLWSTGL